MKHNVLKLLVLLIFSVIISCEKEPYYEEGIDLKQLLASNEWIQTEFTRLDTSSANNRRVIRTEYLKEDFSFSMFDMDCYRNYTYSFNVADSIYTIFDCDNNIVYTEKSIDIRYNPESEYKWEVRFDTLIMFYDLFSFSEYTDFVTLPPRYWKVYYMSSSKIKFFYDKSSVRFLKTFEIKE